MSAEVPAIRLSRAALGAAGLRLPTPPVRIVHLGVGAFARAHQAWYTARASDRVDWGIVGFTGRSSEMAEKLSGQDGLYTLVERSAAGDRFEIVSNLVRVSPGDRVDLLATALRSPMTALVTMTITERGYRVRPDGLPDLGDDAVAADVAALRSALASREPADARPTTALGRLLLGLDARRRAGVPPIALVSCDNIPDNGGLLRTALTGLAELVSPPLSEWMDAGVSFVSTSVDRITPRLAEGDIAAVAEQTGWIDAVPVVTEPFSDWVLSGEFPSGRPHWESAGARFVGELAPYEARKLWMLNGAHTLLAALGRLRGHRTVADAVADPVCLAAVERLWDEDERHLPPSLGVPAYRRALIERFRNPRIEHHLDQIATDALTKLRLRIVPVAQQELAQGRQGDGCALAIAAWIAAVRTGVAAGDASADAIEPASRTGTATGPLLSLVDPDLARQAAFRARVEAALETISA